MSLANSPLNEPRAFFEIAIRETVPGIQIDKEPRHMFSPEHYRLERWVLSHDDPSIRALVRHLDHQGTAEYDELQQLFLSEKPLQDEL